MINSAPKNVSLQFIFKDYDKYEEMNKENDDRKYNHDFVYRIAQHM